MSSYCQSPGIGFLLPLRGEDLLINDFRR